MTFFKLTFLYRSWSGYGHDFVFYFHLLQRGDSMEPSLSLSLVCTGSALENMRKLLEYSVLQVVRQCQSPVVCTCMGGGGGGGHFLCDSGDQVNRMILCPTSANMVCFILHSVSLKWVFFSRCTTI